jgi:hypothetical protein
MLIEFVSECWCLNFMPLWQKAGPQPASRYPQPFIYTRAMGKLKVTKIIL